MDSSRAGAGVVLVPKTGQVSCSPSRALPSLVPASQPPRVSSAVFTPGQASAALQGPDQFPVTLLSLRALQTPGQTIGTCEVGVAPGGREARAGAGSNRQESVRPSVQERGCWSLPAHDSPLLGESY